MSISKNGTSTLAQVAEAAGVSRSTASRALNDSPRISKATKARIRKIAREYNYVPNALGRALASGRSQTMAILITEPLSELFEDPTYSAYMDGIAQELSESSYLPVLLQAATEHERTRVLGHLERRGVDAVINLSPYEGSEVLEALRDLGLPTVLCGQLEGHPYRDCFSTVYSDDVEGAELAARALVERRRTNVVCIMGPKDNPAVIDRLRGYRNVLGARISSDRIIYADGWSSDGGFFAAQQLLAQGTSCDAVLAGSDRIAVGVLKAFSQAEIDVPGDVSVIGFDDHAVAAAATPPLTTVRQPLSDEGALAAATALKMIDGAEPETIVMHMELVRRASL